jgi:hypothetical protein
MGVPTLDGVRYQALIEHSPAGDSSERGDLLMIHLPVIGEREAWAQCYIGFCPGSPPTSLS